MHLCLFLFTFMLNFPSCQHEKRFKLIFFIAIHFFEWFCYVWSTIVDTEFITALAVVFGLTFTSGCGKCLLFTISLSAPSWGLHCWNRDSEACMLSIDQGQEIQSRRGKCTASNGSTSSPSFAPFGNAATNCLHEDIQKIWYPAHFMLQAGRMDTFRLSSCSEQCAQRKVWYGDALYHGSRRTWDSILGNWTELRNLWQSGGIPQLEADVDHQVEAHPRPARVKDRRLAQRAQHREICLVLLIMTIEAHMGCRSLSKCSEPLLES